MSESEDIKAFRITSTSEVSLSFPRDFSFFEPYLQFYVRETIGIGGEAYISRTSDGMLSGVFIYDESEKTGSIFTKSRQAWDYFYGLKSSGSLFAELRTEHECETYDIYTRELDSLPIAHSFKHEIEIAETEEADEISRFMAPNHARMNMRWIKVALQEGEKCFIVRLGQEIAGLAWASLVNRVGRLHSLYVTPQYGRLGIGKDILFARLLWLKSKHAYSAFSEIARDNVASRKIAMKGQMRVCGQVFQYFKPDLGARVGLGNMGVTFRSWVLHRTDMLQR